MKNTPKYFIVEASALPEVFLKVAEAKRLIATGQASTVNEATKMTGISRSAFYKYRDSVQPFQKMNVSRVITFQFVLHDEPGVLSAILSTYATQGALQWLCIGDHFRRDHGNGGKPGRAAAPSQRHQRCDQG